ncbi:MAG TPA: hypothetical protein VFE47_26070 [Tepidisphaeraceae bacterium]|jgi:hypothetical protein|nr:hypothetical protein [Tepidisphaeraceae bacterium]
MSRSAKVQDIDALKEFRIALLNFAEKTTSALGEADSEVQRVTTWLENEQVSYWTSEMRKRHAAVMKAKEALRYKQIFKSPTGGKQSTVDEEKAVSVALRRLAEAEQKMANVKKWIVQLHKETHLYRGAVQRLATTVSVDVPNAGAKISRMVMSLEGYVALSAQSAAPAAEGGDGASVSRGAGPEVGVDYKNLRHRTPAGPAKDRSSNGDSSTAWSAGEFAPGDAERLATVPADPDPLDPAAAIVIAAGVQSARRIYLERSATAFPGDSGWYIGSADGPAASAYESLRLDDLLKARPHFAGLLALPLGSLIVIDPAGIAGVLNGKDEDLWEKIAE